MPAARISALASLALALALAAPAAAQPQADDRFGGLLDAPPPPDGAAPAAPGGTSDLGLVPPPPPDGAPPAGGTFPTAPQAPAGLPGTRPGGFDVPGHVATRLRVLDGDLTALKARGGSHVVDGVLSMVAGGASITIGIVLNQNDDSPGSDDVVSELLYVVGTAAIARGIVNLTLMPDAREPATEFAHMPMRNRREIEERLAFGESTLEHLADRHRTVRLIDAGLNMGVGVAMLPVWLANNDGGFDSAGDYFVVISAGISLLSGIVTLVSQSDAERRWDAYERLRERLLREAREAGGDGATLDADVGIAWRQRHPARGPRLVAGPAPGGGLAGVHWVF